MGFPRQTARKEKTSSLKRVFHIACEGEKTELDYFKIAKKLIENVQLNVNIQASNSKKGSDPLHVLRHMQKNILTRQELKYGDEAWLVIDQDQWTQEHLTQLTQWEQTSNQHGVAMSIPQFEIWLLLHFSDEARQLNQAQCMTELKKHIAGYNKSVPPRCITSIQQIEVAIRRDKKRQKSHYNPENQTNFASMGDLMERCLLNNLNG